MLQCSDIHPVTFFINTRELIKHSSSTTKTWVTYGNSPGMRVNTRNINSTSSTFCWSLVKGSCLESMHIDFVQFEWKGPVSCLNLLFFNADNLKKYVTHTTWVLPSGKVLSKQADRPRFDSASTLLSFRRLWSRHTVLCKPHSGSSVNTTTGFVQAMCIFFLKCRLICGLGTEATCAVRPDMQSVV